MMRDEKIMNDTLAYNDITDVFYEKLHDLLKLYQRVIPVLKDELNSIINEDIFALDECLKSLQALTFQLRALEKESEDILKKNGASNGNFSEAIQEMPANKQVRFFSLKKQFDTSLREISFYRDKCAIMLETRLIRIEKKRLYAMQNEDAACKQNPNRDKTPSQPKIFEVTV